MRALILFALACGGGDDGDTAAARQVPPGAVVVIEPDCPRTRWFRDLDGDGWGDAGRFVTACSAPVGFVEDATDCDDGDATIWPGAPERCDGVDHDCNGLVDEDASPEARDWYEDADGDGFGAAFSTHACARPEGTTDVPGDCDDADAAISPLAVEVCDGLDDDCDGLTDDADGTVTGGTPWYPDHDQDGLGDDAADAIWACVAPKGAVADDTDCDDHDETLPGAWFADADGDGWGDGDHSELACDQPVGGVPLAGDCDDADDTVFPGAPELDCADLVDRDCDGHLSAEDVDGDGAPGCTDCDDADPAVLPGAVERCNGLDDDCDGHTDNGAVDAPDWTRDNDGDGYGDPSLVLHTCEGPAGFVSGGLPDCDDTTHAVSPACAESCSTEADDDCDGVAQEDDATGCDDLYEDEDGDGFGIGTPRCACTADAPWTASVAGDCDDAAAAVNPDADDAGGDGLDANCDDTDISLAHLGALGVRATLARGSAAGAVDRFVVGPDLNGDGLDDIVTASSSSSSRGQTEWNAREAMYGASADLGAGLVVTGVTARAADPPAVLSPGDLTGDGASDLVVAQSEGSTGVTLAAFLPGPLADTVALPDAALILRSAGDTCATLVNALGALDADDDATARLVVGWPGCDTIGLVDPTLTGTFAPGELGERLLSTTGDVRFGAALVAGTDLDGDGVEDLVVSAPAEGTGTIRTFLGPLSLPGYDEDAAGTFAAGPAGFGETLRVVGDLDGDGLPELVAVGTTRVGDAGVLQAPGVSCAGDDCLRTTFPDVEAVDITATDDLDGDGAVDLALAFGPDDRGERALALYRSPVAGAMDLASVSLFLVLPDEARALGHVATRDVDGDGMIELFYGGGAEADDARSGAIWRLDAEALPW